MKAITRNPIAIVISVICLVGFLRVCSDLLSTTVSWAWFGEPSDNLGTVIGGALAGVFTLAAAFIAAAAVYRQIQSAEKLYRAREYAARERIVIDLNTFCEDVNIMWALVDNCIRETDPALKRSWFGRLPLFQDTMRQMALISASFPAVGEPLDAYGQRHIANICSNVAALVRQYEYLIGQTYDDAMVGLTPQIFRVYLSHWLRALGDFAPELLPRFSDRRVVDAAKHNFEYLLNPDWP